MTIPSQFDFTNEPKKTIKAKAILLYFSIACWTICLIINIATLNKVHIIETIPYGLPTLFVLSLLIIGVVLVIFSLIFISQDFKEYQKINSFIIAYIRKTPYWLTIIGIAGFIYAFINFHFVLLTLVGTPEFQGGKYVLLDHGRFIKTITEQEYYQYITKEIHALSGIGIAIYGIALITLFPDKNKGSR